MKTKIIFIKNWFRFLLSILVICLVFVLSLYKKIESKTKVALNDKYNVLIYNYLKQNRKFILLDFETIKTVPVNFCPYYTRFSNWYRYGDVATYNGYRISDYNVLNKKRYILDDSNSVLEWELNFYDGLCISVQDAVEIKGTKTMQLFEYDEYRRLKQFTEKYFYNDETGISILRQYKYVYDYFSKTLFIFEFDNQNIRSVFYINKKYDGFTVSSYSEIFQNKEPLDKARYNSIEIVMEKEKIMTVKEFHYDINGIGYDECQVNYFYESNKKSAEEFLVKRKKDRKFKIVCKIEYQYNGAKLCKKIKTNFDEWDNKNKEISKEIQFNFKYDEYANEVSHDCIYEKADDNFKHEWKVKTDIDYKS